MAPNARLRVKICCIRSVEEAALAVSAGADAVGLVGPMPSGPGPIPEDLIATIASSVPPPVATFLLSSATSAEAIVAQALRTRTSTIQLVSWVDPAQHERARRRLPGVKLVQVLHVEDDAVIDLAQAAASTSMHSSSTLAGPPSRLPSSEVRVASMIGT